MAEEENFGTRPKELVALFARFDRVGAKKLSMPMVEKLLTKFPEASLTTEELNEFKAEAEDQGYFSYEQFIKDVIFGKIK